MCFHHTESTQDDKNINQEIDAQNPKTKNHKSTFKNIKHSINV